MNIDYTDLIIFALLTISILIFTFNWPQIQLGPPQIIYRKDLIDLDLQFSEKNLPSNVYNDIFSSPNVWQGGYNLDSSNLTRTLPLQKNPEQPTPKTDENSTPISPTTKIEPTKTTS
jgi:hypothetical protein